MRLGTGVMAGIAGANTIIGGYAAYKNYQAEQNKLRWDKQVQETTWQREDTATQRKVADLKAAGLSPVLAAGQGASSGPIVSTVAPKVGVPDLMATAVMMKQAELADKQIDQTEAQTEATRIQGVDTYVSSLERLSRMNVNDSIVDRNRSIVAQLPSIIHRNNAEARRALEGAREHRAGASIREFEDEFNRREGAHPRPSAGGALFRDATGLVRRGVQPPSGHNRSNTVPLQLSPRQRPTWRNRSNGASGSY